MLCYIPFSSLDKKDHSIDIFDYLQKWYIGASASLAHIFAQRSRLPKIRVYFRKYIP